ncbi:MAG: AGE family epimerase/isomerase [Planctomycetaceae bacterium]
MQQYLEIYRDGLLNDVVPFWLNHAADRQHGGIMTCVDRRGQVIDTDKGVWQQGRFTWLMARLYNSVEARDEWLQAALSGADFLQRHCFDPADGRMWFHVTQDGQPIRKRRYAFSEAFAAMAFGELFAATGQAEFSELAQKTFQRFLTHNTQPNGEAPKFTATRPMRSIGFPMITINVAQELRASIRLPNADQLIDAAIADIRNLHVHQSLQCVLETVGLDGEVIDHLDGRTLNPGHAIEAAWFVMNEGRHRSNSELIDLGTTMLEWMWARGWDQQHGGILYFTGLDERPVQEYWHDMKFWWPHNETIIATLMAFQLTGNPRYADWHRQVHDWSYAHFPDPEFGEWYGYLHRRGTVSQSAKGNLWKGPFHLPRMQLLCWQLLQKKQREP